MDKWRYSSPEFKCDIINPEMLRYSTWGGHRNFAYDYVANIKPQKVVDLGVHYGTSFFAFLQAVEDDMMSNTNVYGVDLWGTETGDIGTLNDYDIDIFEIFTRTLDIYNCKKNAHIIRKLFDDALASFENEIIDLLHIDGTHTYDAVKHDYETWKHKMRPDGVILFHDISKTSFVERDSAPQFWKELKVQHPYTLEFDHCYGLGILCRSQSMFDMLSKIDFMHYQRINNLLDVQNRDTLRKNYFRLKDNDTYINHLKEQVDNHTSELKKYVETVLAKDRYMNELHARVEIAERDALRATNENEGLKKRLTDLEEMINKQKNNGKRGSH